MASCELTLGKKTLHMDAEEPKVWEEREPSFLTFSSFLLPSRSQPCRGLNPLVAGGNWGDLGEKHGNFGGENGMI